MADRRGPPGADPGRPRTRPPTRGLTEGAVLAALAAVVAAAGLIIPPIAIVLAPLPVMLLVIRWGLRIAVLAAVVSGLILLQFFGPLTALSVTSMFAPLGLALGWGVRRNAGPQVTILAGSAAFLLSTLATLALTVFVLHQDVLGQLIRSQVQGMEMALEWQQRLGAPAARVDEMRRAIDALPQFLRTAFPVMVALGALTWAYLCYVLARSVLRRVGHQIAAVPPILSWRVPPSLTTGLLWVSMGLFLAGLRVPRLAGAAVDAALVNLFVFGFQGALVGITWMHVRRVPRVAQIISGGLVITSGLLPLAGLAILGILDTWYDYRHLAGGGTVPKIAHPPRGGGAAPSG